MEDKKGSLFWKIGPLVVGFIVYILGAETLDYQRFNEIKPIWEIVNNNKNNSHKFELINWGGIVFFHGCKVIGSEKGNTETSKANINFTITPTKYSALPPYNVRSPDKNRAFFGFSGPINEKIACYWTDADSYIHELIMERNVGKGKGHSIFSVSGIEVYWGEPTVTVSFIPRSVYRTLKLTKTLGGWRIISKNDDLDCALFPGNPNLNCQSTQNACLKLVPENIESEINTMDITCPGCE